MSRFRLPLLALLLAGGALFAAAPFVTRRVQAPTHPLTGRQVAGIATNAAWLDRAEREAEEQPDKALDLIGIPAGTVVADVGAGSGYMTLRLARRAGPTGRVFASDLQPAMLAIIQDKVARAGLANVVLVQGTERDAMLPADTMDLVLMVDVYHELWYPQEMLRSLRRSLKTSGRLVLVEYRKEDSTIPILPEHRMSVADARTEVEAERFTFDRLISDLPRQHIIIFRKPPS
jgi:ubiquinone/menaquinone biosynthesis C-methylase UbiE